MNHIITIRLSDAAQRAALLAGQSAGNLQTYEVPQELLPRLLALPWSKVGPDGIAYCDVPWDIGYSRYDIDGKPVGEPIDVNVSSGYGSVDSSCQERPETAEQAIAFAENALAKAQAELDELRRDYIEQQAARKRESKARAEAWADLPLEWRVSEDGVLMCRPMNTPDDYRGPLSNSGNRIVDGNELVEFAPEALEEAKAELERLRAEKQKRKEAEQEARRARLRQMVSTDGTPDQLERFEADVLPYEELVALIVRRLFGHVDLPRYEKLTEQDIAHSDDCYEPVPAFTSDEYEESLNSEQWARFKAIREAFHEDAKLQLRKHMAWCRTCDDDTETIRLGVRVTLKFAGSYYTVEYAL